jgi:hypothetical protein
MNRGAFLNRMSRLRSDPRRVGVNRGFAPGRGEEIEETILRLD